MPRNLFGNLTRIVFAGLIIFSLSSAKASGSSGITYHGRILKPDGTPLEGQFVRFKIQIRTPDPANCLMYEEEQTLDMRNSNGIFAITINDGKNSQPSFSNKYSLDQVFANRGSFTFDSSACVGGPPYYNPNLSDGRRLQVYFRDESMSDWVPMPLANINFVPMAIEAKQVAGFGVYNLLRVDDSAAAQNLTPFSLQELTDLKALLAGTSSLYLKSSTGAGATLPVFSGDPSSPTQGSIWFDSVTGELKYHDGTNVKTVGSGTGSGTVTSITAGDGLTGGTITTSGTIALADVGSPGTYFKVTTDSKGRIISGDAALDSADIPALDWSKITTGKPTTLDGYGITDAVKNAGGVTSVQAGADADKSGVAEEGKVYFATDTQKVYRYESGNWHLIAGVGASGTVTDVTAQAPLSSSGGNTPQISISQASASQDGYLSAADWSKFDSKLGSELEAGKIFVGNSSNLATAVLATGDATISETGMITVQGLLGRALSTVAPVNGQVLKYVDGTNQWTPSNLTLSDLKNSLGGSAFNISGCAAHQTVKWTSLTDTFECVDIAIASTQISDITATGSAVLTAANPAAARAAIDAMANIAPGSAGNVLQSNGTNWVSAALDWSHIADKPTTVSGYGITDAVIKGGQTGSVTLGSTDANSVSILTDNSTRIRIDSSGKVGIGTASPAFQLDVSGTIRALGSSVITSPTYSMHLYNRFGVYGNGGASSTQYVLIARYSPGTSWAHGTNPRIRLMKEYYDASGGVTEYIVLRNGTLVMTRSEAGGADLLRITGPTSYGGRSDVYELWLVIPAYYQTAVEFSHVGYKDDIASAASWEGSILEVDTSNNVLTTDPGGLVAAVTGIVQSVAGNVGVGVSNPAAKLDVSGGIKVANDTTSCNASKAGTIRWTGTAFEGCNGSDWVSLAGGGGGGITSCPAGWTMIGDPGKPATFCIETNERSATNWFNAHSTCNAINDSTIGLAHLCTYNEWYTACVRGTGLSDMTNNEEWVADLDSAHGAIVSGNGSCATLGYNGKNNSSVYRCCLR